MTVDFSQGFQGIVSTNDDDRFSLVSCCMADCKFCFEFLPERGVSVPLFLDKKGIVRSDVDNSAEVVNK